MTDLVTQVAEVRIQSFYLGGLIRKGETIMDPKYNARRGYRERALKREQARKDAAAGWQLNIDNTKKPFKEEGKIMNRWIQIILFLFCGLFVLAAILLPALGVFRVDGILVLYILGIILLAVSILLVALMWPPSWWVWLMLGIGVIFTLLSILGSNLWGWGMTKSSTPADIDPVTEITPNPPTPLVKEPVPNVGQIFVDGQETGVILDDGTVAITNGRILCNHDAPYDTDELAIVESTWVDYQIQTQKGEFAVVFGYGIKVGDTIYSPGAIILVASNGETAEISVLNGEVIIWNDISKMHSDIENRISDEIKNGNMTIKGPLAFKYVSQEFRGYIPQELFDTRQIEIVPTH